MAFFNKPYLLTLDKDGPESNFHAYKFVLEKAFSSVYLTHPSFLHGPSASPSYPGQR